MTPEERRRLLEALVAQRFGSWEAAIAAQRQAVEAELEALGEVSGADAWEAVAPAMEAILSAPATGTALGLIWRTWRRFADVIWNEPQPVGERIGALGATVAAAVMLRVVTEVYRQENEAEADRARRAGEELRWFCEEGYCPECSPFCGESAGSELPPVHPNCRCLVLALAA